MATFGLDLMSQSIDLPCPSCEYPIWILWAEAAAQVTVRCPCCRAMVRIVDETGSVQTTPAQMRDALQDLDRTLRSAFQ